MKNFLYVLSNLSCWRIVSACIILGLIPASLNAQTPATGSLSVSTAGFNSTGQPLIFSWTWNVTTHIWTLKLDSGPSTGWTASVQIWTNRNGGSHVQFTSYGQTVTSFAAPNAAMNFGLYNIGGTSHNGRGGTLPANGPDEDLSQTASLSPDGGAASLIEGQSFSGTATGAQAGNPYNISIVSGAGSASINSSTGSYTIIANGAGLITYKVWISAGSGYTRSPDAQASIAVTASKRVRITIPANNTPYPIEYRIMQDGAEIGYRLQNPGASAIIAEILTSSDSPVTVVTNVKNLQIIDDQWVEVPDAVTPVNNNTPPITPTTDPSPTVVPTPPVPDNSPTAPPNQNDPVWKPTPVVTDPDQQVDLLTNATFKEGVGKITSTEWDIWAEVKEFFTPQKDLNDKEADAVAANPTQSAMDAAGQQAKADSQTAITNIDTSIATTTAPAASGSTMNLNGGQSFTGFTATVSAQWLAMWDYFEPIFSWIREIIRWVVVVFYTLWVFQTLNKQLELAMVLPQAKGNPVVGGTGAQATALIAAAAITGVLLTFPVGLWAIYSTNLPVGVLLNVAAAPIASTAPSVTVAMGWLATALPIDTILQIAPVVIIVKKAGLALTYGVAAVIRFFVM